MPQNIDFLNLKNKKTNILTKKGQKSWTETLPKKIYRWQINILKDAQCHLSLKNCTLKRWDVTTCLLK